MYLVLSSLNDPSWVLLRHVSFILRYLAHQVERSRHYPCAVNQLSAEPSPRVDAQASRERTGIGGWLPLRDGSRRISTSPWFSLEITRDMLPWVFAKGDKPAQVIATLEALAVVVSLRAFHGRRVPDGRTRATVAPTWTDNRGNGAALNKLMSTKYPVSAVLVELASYMKEQSLKVLGCQSGLPALATKKLTVLQTESPQVSRRRTEFTSTCTLSAGRFSTRPSPWASRQRTISREPGQPERYRTEE